MPRVFIVRPFGENRMVLKKKPGTTTDEYLTEKFNFNRVETDLIRPAMEATNLTGGPTTDVFAAGDIREDMFSSLLLDDIVIADITVHNANVFYELGIRHALRDKRTILIKCSGYDETPFDIIGYRYVTYDKDAPGKALEDLKKTIIETIDPQNTRKDSPVFNVLPGLQPQDAEQFLAVPVDFGKELAMAIEANDLGWITLLAGEAAPFAWKRPAFRLLGNAFFDAKEFNKARMLFEDILDVKPFDRQANDRLATVYQRLAEIELGNTPTLDPPLLQKSDAAINNLLANKSLTTYERAEAIALKARNAKIRWFYEWKTFPEKEMRQQEALKSSNLYLACDLYEQGFKADLNHYYSGVNALGLLLLTTTLAKRYPAIWNARFQKQSEATRALNVLKERYKELLPVEELSITTAIDRAKAIDPAKPDIWAAITYADLLCLISPDPVKVAYQYGEVVKGLKDQNKEAIIRQLSIYLDLGIQTQNVEAALKAITPPGPPKQKHAFLFTGHMIDKDDCAQSRFPASKEQEIRQKIHDAVSKEKTKLGSNVSIEGIAGGACGGDILFHEVCAELEIPSKMCLALPVEQFVVNSVTFAGGNWLERFNALYKNLRHPLINEKGELPGWLKNQQSSYTVWERNNRWELYSALAAGGPNTTIFALWDGKPGLGPGGTADMVQEAKKNWDNLIQIQP